MTETKNINWMNVIIIGCLAVSGSIVAYSDSTIAISQAEQNFNVSQIIGQLDFIQDIMPLVAVITLTLLITICVYFMRCCA